MSVTVPTGNPPPGFAARQAIERAAVNGVTATTLPADTVIPSEVEAPPSPPLVPSEPVAPASPGLNASLLTPTPEKPTEKVRLKCPAQEKFPGFTIEFSTFEVDVGGNYVALLCEPHFSFEPGGVMDLTLTHAGRDYAVKWVGGNFKFTKRGHSCISFLRKPSQDGQK